MSAPDRFSEALEGFRSSILADRLAHAYVVIGSPRGEAAVFAERVLGMLFCTGADKPCGACRGCRDVRDRTHPDISWVEPIKKSQGILVAQVREVRHRMSQTAFAGEWKACVIVAADRLNEEASNVFLKTLEEPLGRSLFLLLSDAPQSLLPTVLSRCQRVTLTGTQIDLPPEIWERLRAILTPGEPDALLNLWRARQFEQLLRGIRSEIEKEEKSGLEDGVSEEALEARVNARHKEARTALMRAMLLWHRDVLLIEAGADDACLQYRSGEDVALARKQAERLTYTSALQNVRTIERMQELLSRNVPEDSVFVLGFSRIIGQK